MKKAQAASVTAGQAFTLLLLQSCQAWHKYLDIQMVDLETDILSRIHYSKSTAGPRAKVVEFVHRNL
jgi:hypothetical protein